VISNGVPPPPPNVALSFGAVTAVSNNAISDVVVGAVSADKGMVVTDGVSGSDGGTDVVKIVEAASDGPRDIDIVDEEAVFSEPPIELSLIGSGTLLGLRFDVSAIVGCPSIPSAVSESVGPRALGHMAVVPSEMKNKPINISRVALDP
jgi:hypothetical protein